MKVAFVVDNPSNTYSGGRIHALSLACAFANLEYEVDYYTNHIPIFFEEFADDISKSKINFILNKFYLWKFKGAKYEHVVVVPHLLSRKSFIFDKYLFYPFVSFLGRKSGAPIWYLDFESPNWLQSTDPSLRSLKSYKYSNAILKDCSIILSTTKLGLYYAKQYYHKFNSELKYYQLYLSINKYSADNTSYDRERDNKIVFFGRFGQLHKNPAALINIVESLPSEYELAIIGNKNKIDSTYFIKLKLAAINNHIKLVFYSNISDKEKFELISTAKLLIFSSKFEGYGLPPIEAQYVGTNVLCSDIPVLREVNKYARFTDFSDLGRLKKDIQNCLLAPIDPLKLRTFVETFATPEVFMRNLSQIIDNYKKSI